MLALRTFKALAAESSRHSNFWVLLGYKYGKENVQSVGHYHMKNTDRTIKAMHSDYEIGRFIKLITKTYFDHGL